MLNYPKTVKIVIAFLLCIVLSACTTPTGSPPATLTPALLATLTPELVIPTTLPTMPRPSTTFTATLRPSQTPTFTPIPYLTAAYNQSSLTPALIQPTNTSSANTEATLTWGQAYDQALLLTATQIASFPVSCDDINPYYTLQSPDGNWLAIRCSYHSNQKLEVVSKEGKRWVLQYIDFLSKDFIQDGDPGLGGMYPEHWSGDGKYLYFTTRLGISGGGPCFYGWNADGLYRINVNDGMVTTMLEAIPSSGAFYDIAFSPGGRRFAYEYDYDHLAIVDLRTGEALTIESGDDGVGNLRWSPDGSHLAYGICRDNQEGTITVKSSIKIYSVETHTSKTILEVKQTLLRIESRNGDQVLIIANHDLQGTNETDYLFFDWSSAQLTTATPTP
jgi:WD40 repeat protein